MTIDEFKQAIVEPLRKSIEQNRSATLAQFGSRDDLNKQWDIGIGMQLSINHIESVYANSVQAPLSGAPEITSAN
jgi:hypothetical protein